MPSHIIIGTLVPRAFMCLWTLFQQYWASSVCLDDVVALLVLCIVISAVREPWKSSHSSLYSCCRSIWGQRTAFVMRNRNSLGRLFEIPKKHNSLFLSTPLSTAQLPIVRSIIINTKLCDHITDSYMESWEGATGECLCSWRGSRPLHRLHVITYMR